MSKYELKTKRQGNDGVHAFIDSFADDPRYPDIIKINELFTEETGQQPEMWGTSIVGYGTYHYVYDSGQEGDWMAAGFSPRKQNLTLYIMEGFDGHTGMLDQLGPHKTGKSCLYIKRLGDVDESILRQMIRSSYNHVVTHMNQEKS